ncbi:hypothetical protein BKA82DRAFT_142859 [Pisolithus tinctorius]|uniref:Uncharacterized protein n=1 Tax=Pisolithus tinctorius Marx 270 TaxID=870435 RepID=A0A0C3K4T0_PISTI|nr:hypothetical protein BKA82DRAFT_142859 [Pisolithus tinctorius]KIO04587.1 hypothetical protein M404DRAFT_142859 [Pisolithus tinctorius Marx 270]
MSNIPPAEVSSSIDSSKSPPSPSSILENLKDNTLAIYAATPNLAGCIEFFFGSTTGDVAVLKSNNDEPTELVLSGIFEIDCQGFFMGADGGYSSKNTFSHTFAETKLTCNLLAVQQDVVYGSTQHDFSLIISNIRALEKLVPLKKGESLLSSVHESQGMPCIRLSHALFMEELEDLDDITRIGLCLLLLQDWHSHLHATEDATMTWPVHEDHRDTLTHAASTHYISTLPAFDIDGMPIQPADYHCLLCGTIIQVHFALLHFFIKGDRKSIFTTSLREMHIL